GLLPAPWRRWQASVPDGPIVELNEHAIGGINRTFVEGINPDPACRRKPVRPRARRHARLGQEIKLISVLRDMGRQTSLALVNARIDPGQIDRLSPCAGSREHGQYADNQ